MKEWKERWWDQHKGNKETFKTLNWCVRFSDRIN